jgi:hypothetical protein
MSQYTGGSRSATPAGNPGDRPTTQVARDETAAVGRTGADAAGQVAGTAAEQARNVAQEATAQARDLVGEARNQVQEQARNGQRKAGEGVRALGRELREMAEGGQRSGPASEVARQIADRADRVAGWLGEREPGELLEEARSFARRRPGAFLVGAALAGVIIGRLTRGVVDATRGPSDVSPGGSGLAPEQAYGPPGYVPARPAPLAYDSPVAAPLAPAGAAGPRPAPGGDPYQPAHSGGPLGTPTPAAPVTTGTHGARPGAHGADTFADELEREAGRRPDGLSVQSFQSEYGGPR